MRANRTSETMGNQPLYLRATMLFGAGDQPDLFRHWAHLTCTYARWSGFHSAYLLRGVDSAPSAAGLALFTDRAAHDRTLEQALPPASAPGQRPARDALIENNRVSLPGRDIVPLSFRLTTLTGELPTAWFSARLLLHREPEAATPALRRFLRQRRVAGERQVDDSRLAGERSPVVSDQDIASRPLGFEQQGVTRRPLGLLDQDDASRPLAEPADTVCTGTALDGGRLHCALVLSPGGSWQLPEADHLADWWSFAPVAVIGNDGHAERLDGHASRSPEHLRAGDGAGWRKRRGGRR